MKPLLLLLFLALPTVDQQPPTFAQLLQQIAPVSADPCDSMSIEQNTTVIETSIFRQAADAFTAALNQPGSPSPQTRAEQALAALELQSAQLNSSWPDENRLHHELLNLSPILVLKLTFRSQARFIVLAIPEGTPSKPNHLWQQVGSDSTSFEHQVPWLRLELHPLRRGPSGAPRFLAAFNYSGCAGSSGIQYEAVQWNQGGGYTETILKQDGAFGIDEAPASTNPWRNDEFPVIGKLDTTGKFLRLPYCTFTGIDFWDNPTLCSLDTYDLSGDTVAFQSRRYNRPDLAPLALAIRYAEQHDLPATRAYTTTEALARHLVRDGAPHSDGGLTIDRISPTRRRINMNSAIAIVEKRHHHWLLRSLTLN